MPPVPLDSVHLPEPTINHRFLDELRSTMHGHQICDSRYERVVHTYGKGFRDLQENGGAIKYEGKWDLLGDAAQSGVCRYSTKLTGSYKELSASGSKRKLLSPTCGRVKCFLLFGMTYAIGRVRLPMSDRLLARQT